MTDRNTRLIGLYAVLAAITTAVVSPLLTLAYLRTGDGAGDLDSGLVSWWADPALHHLGGLATWGSPGRAYATYVQLLALSFPAVPLCALAARRRTSASSRERRRGWRWGWRIALAGYGVATVALLAAAVALVPGDADSPVLNAVFTGLMLPGMLISLIGSTVLGIAMLRGGHRPAATAWLLTLAIPLFIAGNLLGHNSLGMAPLLIAWGITGLALRRPTRTLAPVPATATR